MSLKYSDASSLLPSSVRNRPCPCGDGACIQSRTINRPANQPIHQLAFGKRPCSLSLSLSTFRSIVVVSLPAPLIVRVAYAPMRTTGNALAMTLVDATSSTTASAAIVPCWREQGKRHQRTADFCQLCSFFGNPRASPAHASPHLYFDHQAAVLHHPIPRCQRRSKLLGARHCHHRSLRRCCCCALAREAQLQPTDQH